MKFDYRIFEKIISNITEVEFMSTKFSSRVP
jgi:hypothetical protein